MAEINVPPCPTHGSFPRALHSESFEGIVTVIEELISTVSGVGTTSFSRCPYGYPFNFEGVVRALEDLNTSISGISAGGAAGSGIVAGSGIYITQSGTFEVINATVTSASGITYTAGSGIYLSDGGTKFNLYAEGEGTVTVSYSGSMAVISGTESAAGGGASVTVSVGTRFQLLDWRPLVRYQRRSSVCLCERRLGLRSRVVPDECGSNRIQGRGTAFWHWLERAASRRLHLVQQPDGIVVCLRRNDQRLVRNRTFPQLCLRTCCSCSEYSGCWLVRFLYKPSEGLGRFDLD